MNKGIDDLLRYLVQQIALRSRHGATTDYVIDAVAQFYSAGDSTNNPNGNATTQLAADKTYLEQIWTWLLQNPDISLGQRPGDEVVAIGLSEVQAFNSNLEKRLHAHGNTPKSKSKASRGNATETDESKYQHLRLFASEDQVWRALTGHGIDQRKVSALEFVLLTTIASFREEGVTQPDLPDLTGQDKRSIPQRTSKLAEMGYIIKKTIHTPGKITSRLILKQFAAGLDNDRAPLSGKVDRESWSWQKFGKWVALLKDALKAVKDAGDGGIAWRDLRELLAITRDRSKASKVIIDAMQRFRYLGCVDITRTVGYVPSDTDGIINRIKDIEYIRDVTEDDWTKFWSLGQSLTKVKGRRKSLSMTLGLSDSHATESPDEMDVNPQGPSNSGEGANNSTSLSKIKPIWTPDRPLVNITWSTVRRAGAEGIITSQATARAAGKFFSRPLSTLLVDLSNSAWDHRYYASQHLQIVRDAVQVGRYTVFRFYTFSDFQRMVDVGEKKWQWIERPEPKPESAGPSEFSDLSNRLFVDGESSASLEQCLVVALRSGKIRNTDPKKVSGVAEPPEPGSATKIRKVRSTGAERPRKFKSTYTQEELDKMKPNERRAALNTVQNGRRYHYKQVEAKVMVRLNAGDDIEKAGETVRMDIMVRVPRGDSAAKFVQLEVLPEVLAKLRRGNFPPSVAAHTVVYPGPYLRRMAPPALKGRPPKPKTKVTAKQPKAAGSQKAAKEPKPPQPAPLVRSKPIKSAIGYIASSFAHSRSISLPGGPVIAVPVQPVQPPLKGRTAKSAIKILYGGKKTYYPSIAAHSDFSYHLSHKKEPKKRVRQLKKTGIAAPSITPAVHNAADAMEVDAPASTEDMQPSQGNLVAQLLLAAAAEDPMDVDIGPAPVLAHPPEPVVSRSGREIKQTTKIITSAASAATYNTNDRAKSHLEMSAPTKKKSVGALTYEEQYKWLRDEQTPGVYVGPICSLKTGTKGRGPKSWLAVFRSRRLRDPSFVEAERPTNFIADLVETARRQLEESSRATSVARASAPLATSPVRAQTNGHEGFNAHTQADKARKRKRSPLDDGSVLTKKHKTTQLSGQHHSNAQVQPQAVGVQIAGASSSQILSNHPIPPLSGPSDSSGAIGTASERPDAATANGNFSRQLAESADIEMAHAQDHVGHAATLQSGPDGDEQTLKKASGLDLVASVETDSAAKNTHPDEDLEILDVDKSNPTPPPDQTERTDDQPPPPHVQHRVRTSQLPKATPLRGTTFSKPAPRKKLVPQAVEGVSRHGGSLMAERKNIILDIVRKNGGFFAVGHEIWFPFATQWAKRHGPNRPDTRTIQNVVKQLVNETKVKEYNFNFKDKGGILRTKKIILLPEISRDDERILTLKKKIAEYYPHVYVPEGTEYDQALRHDPYRTTNPVGHRRGESTAGSDVREAPARRLGGPPRVDIEQKRLLEQNAAQRRLQKAADKLAEQQRAENPEDDDEHGTASLQVQDYDHAIPQMAKYHVKHRGQYDLAMKPTKQSIDPSQMRDTENLDPNGPIYLPLPGYKANGQTTRRQREGAIETINLLDEAARSGVNVSYDRNWTPKHKQDSKPRAAPRLGRRPPKPPHLQTAPKGLQYVIDERSKHIAPQKALAVQHLDSKQDYFSSSGTFGTFLEIPGWFAPRDVDDILNHRWPGQPIARLSSANSRDAAFVHVVDRIKKWEMTDRDSQNVVSNGWINLTMNSQTTRAQRRLQVPQPQPEEPSKKKRRAPGTAPKEPRALDRILALKRPGGRINSEHPDAPAAKKRQTQGTRHRPQDPLLDRRILLAIIVTKIIYRAGDPRYIDWDIVQRVLGEELTLNIIRKRYNQLRTPWKAWAAQTKKDLEERFLIAYEAGDLPTIHYDDLEKTEWTKVMAWVEKQSLSEENMAQGKRSDRTAVPKVPSIIPDLTSSREGLEKRFAIKDYPNKADPFEIRYKGTRAALRREWQHEDAHVVPFWQRNSNDGQIPTETVARSWVRATALTAQERYNGYKASKKLGTIPVEYVAQGEQELFAHKALMQHTKNVQAGERPVDVSQTFVANLRMNLGIFHHQEAVDFKQRLDAHFREESVVDFQQSADDGHMLVLLNMYAQGMISFQARDIKSTPMGPLKNNYKTRTIDKNILQFTVEIRPTAQYAEGLFAESLLEKAQVPKQTNEQGVDITPLPLWIDVHGNHENLTWHSALNVLFTTCIVRPGVTADEIAKYVYPTLEAWELRILMQWTVDAGLTQWVGEKKNGVKLMPKWWSWLGLKFRGE